MRALSVGTTNDRSDKNGSVNLEESQVPRMAQFPFDLDRSPSVIYKDLYNRLSRLSDRSLSLSLSLSLPLCNLHTSAASAALKQTEEQRERVADFNRDHCP